MIYHLLHCNRSQTSKLNDFCVLCSSTVHTAMAAEDVSFVHLTEEQQALATEKPKLVHKLIIEFIGYTAYLTIHHINDCTASKSLCKLHHLVVLLIICVIQ
jgi:hypothetical protein